MRTYPLAVALSLAAPCAQAAPAIGYVVKVEGAKVFLDFGAASGAAVGQPFTVFSEGETLKHPVTGEELGKEEKTLAAGQIIEVHEKYSLGEVSAPAAGLAPGQRTRLGAPPPPPAPVAPAAPPPVAAAVPAGRAPYFRSPTLNVEAVDLALADVNGDGAEEIVLAGKNTVAAYPLSTQAGPWKASCSYKDDGTSIQFLSVEAADLDKDGKAEVFATVNNLFFGRVETYVLVCQDGVFKKAATLPWMVRGYATPDGSWHLAAQQLLPDGTFPLSNIYPLQFADGRWGPAKEPLHYKRVEWLYGLLVASQDGQDVPVFLTKANRLRLQFDKDSWVSPETYGQTSNRVRWKDKPLEFHPRLVPEPGASGLAGLYTLKNIPRFGSLSEPLGIYSRAELHYLRFNGLSLEPAWSTELAGYTSGLARSKSGDLITAVVGSSGRTSVWFFKP